MQSGQEGAACWRQLRSASPHGHSDKFPDTFIFALLALASVVLGALFVGATPSAIAVAFGDGFWNLIPFTMQMVMVVITGHVVASARPTEKLTKKLARVPRSGRGAIVYIAVLSMTTSLLS
jgi:short-chain fatty acids transporter